MNKIYKSYFRNIFFAIIVLFTFIVCRISNSSYIIFTVLCLITEGASIVNNYYYKKDLYYTKPMYVKAILIGILIAFIVEQKGEFARYFAVTI